MELEKSSLDEKLLSLARKSPVEIAELTGLEPQYVAERIAYLLDSKDWLTDRQEERLLLIEAGSLKDKAFAMLDGVGPQEFAGVANVVLKSLRLVSERLDARRKLVDDDIDRITVAHAKMLRRLLIRLCVLSCRVSKRSTVCRLMMRLTSWSRLV